MKALVRCRKLVCRLGGQRVLDGTDLEIAEGEAMALLGSSGSGKSTLLRVIAGLEVAERGDVSIAGRLATDHGRLLIPPHKRGVGMLFQDLALWPNLTVTQNVRLGLSGLRLSRSEAKKRIDQTLRQCDIRDLALRRPGTLSGGQQQRAALARTLAMHPQLLLLDEPFGGLDLLTKQAVLEEVVRLKSELGFAIVLVTHDPAEVRSLCQSLCVLEAGRIVDRGDLDAFVARPKSALARAFVRALQQPRKD